MELLSGVNILLPSSEALVTQQIVCIPCTALHYTAQKANFSLSAVFILHTQGIIQQVPENYPTITQFCYFTLLIFIRSRIFCFLYRSVITTNTINTTKVLSSNYPEITQQFPSIIILLYCHIYMFCCLY